MQPVLLIQLRNVWGTFNWDGAWSSKSANWNRDLFEAVGYTDEHNREDAELFFMSFDDFCMFFKQV